MTNKIFVGADPGKLGAISFLYPNGEIKSFAYPLLGKEYDIREFSKIFAQMSELNVHLIVEDVHAMQMVKGSGNWSLSRGKAILETLAIVYNIPHTLVHPKTWQKEMWQGIPEQRKPSTYTQRKGKVTVKKGAMLTKEMSILAVKRLFPNADLRNPNRKTDRATKPHDGVVDAILLAEYGRRKIG
jgi:hypothetical protein